MTAAPYEEPAGGDHPRSPRFLTLQQVCEELNVQRPTMMGLVTSGELPAIRVGGRGQWRIERTKLEDYIAAAYERARADLARGEQAREQAGEASGGVEPE